MPNILITGGAGYIGQVLSARLLLSGFNVVAMDNLMYGQTAPLHLLSHPCYTFVHQDVRDVKAVADHAKHADVVIPLAALVGAPVCDRNPGMAKQVNEMAIILLLDELSGRQIVIYPNTNSGYGHQPDMRPCTEDMKLTPISWYAETKQLTEAAVVERGNAYVLRLATVFGPSPRMRFDLMVNDFVYHLITHKKIEVYEADYMRNFIHVADVADCITWLLTDHYQPGPTQVFNLGNDEVNMSKRELAHLIADMVGGEVANKEGNDTDQRNYVVSSAKLAEAGFKATRSLRDGVAEVDKIIRMIPERSLAKEGPGPWRNA